MKKGNSGLIIGEPQDLHFTSFESIAAKIPNENIEAVANIATA